MLGKCWECLSYRHPEFRLRLLRRRVDQNLKNITLPVFYFDLHEDTDPDPRIHTDPDPKHCFTNKHFQRIFNVYYLHIYSIKQTSNEMEQLQLRFSDSTPKAGSDRIKKNPVLRFPKLQLCQIQKNEKKV